MSYQLQQNALLPLLARTIVLSFGHIAAKKLFADPKGREHTVIKTCCAVKALISWNTEKSCRIARERCGGATFLEINLAGPGMFGAHSGSTAEGDNKVLMQKVVKDILTHARKDMHDAPDIPKEEVQKLAKMDDVSDFGTLAKLIYLREGYEIRAIAKKLQKSILEQEKKFFDVWMYESNEDIQAVATAFGERYFLQAAIGALE